MALPFNPYTYGAPDPAVQPGNVGLGGLSPFMSRQYEAPQDPPFVMEEAPSALSAQNPYLAQMQAATQAASAPMPTRNFRREGRGAVIAGAAGGLLGLLTGNAAIGFGAAGAGIQGYQRGADERFGQQMDQAQNNQRMAQAQANYFRQMGQQFDANRNADARLDQQEKLARQQQIERAIAGFPAFRKEARESNPNASPQELGAIIQKRIDAIDEMAGGPGRSGLSLRQMELKPSEVTITGMLQDDGSPAPGQVKPGGTFPVVDPIAPKGTNDFDRAKAGSAFLAGLLGMDAESQQQRIALAERNGELDQYNLSIPKDVSGRYDIRLAKAPTPTPAPDPAAEKRKQVAESLEYNRKLFANPQTNAKRRGEIASVIAQQEKFLGIGTGQPLPADAVLPMTPFQSQGLKLRESDQAIRVRGQDKTAATAAANRAAANQRAANSNSLQRDALALQRQALKTRISNAKPGATDTAEGILKEIAFISKPSESKNGKDAKGKPILIPGVAMTDTEEGKAYKTQLEQKLYNLQTKGVSGKGISSLPGLSMRPSALPGAAASQTLTPRFMPRTQSQPRNPRNGQFQRPKPQTRATGKPGAAASPSTTKYKTKSGSTITITG